MLRRILTPSFIVFSCFILGGMIFKSVSPIRCDTILPTDSIFVLTGDERRIPFAMRKMREFPNTDLYIIGAGAQGNIDLNVSRPAIIESKSKSTYQNALAIKDIASRRNLDRIVIITTEDHMNRARYLIQKELPNTQIIACPVTLAGMPPGRRLERWATEYIKYIVTMFGIKES
ncbi:MAG: YdcF family protein [Alphaproteobacteria bacterium]|nr:YdcF family protein [Alphaproteobacteria bacterium]